MLSPLDNQPGKNIDDGAVRAEIILGGRPWALAQHLLNLLRRVGRRVHPAST